MSASALLVGIARRSLRHPDTAATDWPRWERRIMQGPYIHHCSAVYGHCADVLEEACRYIPGLVFERFDQPADRR